MLLLIEGHWHTGAGLAAVRAQALVEAAGLREIAVRRLDDPALWGSEITDERYLLTARSHEAVS